MHNSQKLQKVQTRDRRTITSSNAGSKTFGARIHLGLPPRSFAISLRLQLLPNECSTPVLISLHPASDVSANHGTLPSAPNSAFFPFLARCRHANGTQGTRGSTLLRHRHAYLQDENCRMPRPLLDSGNPSRMNWDEDFLLSGGLPKRGY